MSNPLEPVPTDELVAVAWIGSIPGISPQMVATQLPEDANADGTPAEWVTARRGFITVTVVGGSPAPSLPLSRPVFQVDCWAVVPGSNKPPWGVANRLAEAVKQATWDRHTFSRSLTITVNRVQYPPAVVLAARLVTQPRRVWSDEGDYARYQADLALDWITPGYTID